MSIPDDLQTIPQWVDLSLDREGKAKLPKDVTDKTTWGAFAPKKGFVLAGYIGIDFDNLFDEPQMALWLPWLDKIKAITYTEKSMSGKGAKAILKGNFQAKAKMKGGRGIEFDIAPHTGIAFYTPWFDEAGTLQDGRQFAMTGNALEGTVQAIGQDDVLVQGLYDAVVEWHAKAKGKKAPKIPKEPPVLIPLPEPTEDDVILDRAMKAKNGAKVAELWANNIAGYPSPSEADMALANCLAFWTRDAAQIERLMQRSGLARAKWTERPDYLQGTITNALQYVTEHKQEEVFNKAVAPPADELILSVTILPSEYRVYPTGVIQVDTRVNKNGEVREDIKDIAKWHTFKADRVLDDHGLIKYELTIDGTAYQGTIDDIVKLTKTPHGLCAHYTHVMGHILKSLVDKLDPPRAKIYPFIGFQDGWKVGLNGEAFDINEVQREFLDIEIWKAPLDMEAGKKAFQDLYNATTIDHKDIITAWGVMAPFLHDLASSIDLATILSLGGIPGTAKSKKLEELTMKWWAWTSYRINCATIGTPSRFDDLLTFATFPTLVDEVDKFPIEHTGKIKQITTGRGKNIKKGKGLGGQGLMARGVYCSTPCFTYNYQNPLYDDSAMLERVLDVQIKTKNTIEGGKAYMAVYEAIPNGLIGRCIIEATKTYTHKDIMAIYTNAPDYPAKEGEKVDDRVNKIFKTIYTGAILAKRIFGVELKLDALPNLVKNSRNTGSDETIAFIYEYVAEQEKDKKDRASWVQSEMYIVSTNEKKMAYFSSGSAKDISNRAGKKIPLSQLAGIIDRAYASVKYFNTRAGTVPGWYCVVNLTKGYRTKNLGEQATDTEGTDEP